jgi:hypothetical protein
MNKQNILCLPNLRKKQSENNQLSKAIEDTRQVSQNLVEN